MDVQLLGTGGPDGWPRPGCRCACCARGRAAGRSRSPAAVVVDGTLRIAAGQPPRAGALGPAPGGAGPGRAAGTAGARIAGAGTGPAEPEPLRAVRRGGHVVRRVPGGWDVTGPDGGRLLIAGEPGAVPEPGAGARPYDVALLDLVASPFQLGGLRQRGLVRAGTAVAAFHLDDRISSEQEMARRCLLWGVHLPEDGDHLREPAPGPAPPARTLVLGGARSGKSQEAELRLAGEPDVTYLATAAAPDGMADPDLAQRIAAHRARRPPGWTTAAGVDAAGLLRKKSSGAVLMDGIGMWLAGVLDQSGAWDQVRDGTADQAAGSAAAKRIDAAVDDLIDAWRQAPARIVAVSDEAGSGVVPPTRAGRLFRDRLGLLNQRLAAESEEVVLVIAGRILTPVTGR
ncbi:MAG TPA: bifunctional adenosylcobinamide kinase/adenosylcobinamide-phosphate guanylyltransferase [Streptosporangiaceae bacterium]|nr:bifunctional adenosylcobinamide kinase/adenosylcobinamide-phosphate guanylyltransferase [Streptosporangiaceae bacterium]